jgi:hypothetical protein
MVRDRARALGRGVRLRDRALPRAPHPAGSARPSRSADRSPRAAMRVRLRDEPRHAQGSTEGQGARWLLVGRVRLLRVRLAGSVLCRERRGTAMRGVAGPWAPRGSRGSRWSVSRDGLPRGEGQGFASVSPGSSPHLVPVLKTALRARLDGVRFAPRRPGCASTMAVQGCGRSPSRLLGVLPNGRPSTKAAHLLRNPSPGQAQSPSGSGVLCFPSH